MFTAELLYTLITDLIRAFDVTPCKCLCMRVVAPRVGKGGQGGRRRRGADALGCPLPTPVEGRLDGRLDGRQHLYRQAAGS